jgi:hypothetical protein
MSSSWHIARNRALDLLAVLVGAGEKAHVTAVEPHEAGQHVGRHGRVGVAEMRVVVDVIDRRRQEIAALGGHDLLPDGDMGRGRRRTNPPWPAPF